MEYIKGWGKFSLSLLLDPEPSGEIIVSGARLSALRPIAQEPIAQEPITQEPITQEPITQEPALEGLTSRKPALTSQEPTSSCSAPRSSPRCDGEAADLFAGAGGL